MLPSIEEIGVKLGEQMLAIDCQPRFWPTDVSKIWLAGKKLVSDEEKRFTPSSTAHPRLQGGRAARAEAALTKAPSPEVETELELKKNNHFKMSRCRCYKPHFFSPSSLTFRDQSCKTFLA